MNLGFKSKLTHSLLEQAIHHIIYAVEAYVEYYVISSAGLRCKRRFEYVRVVLLSRYSTGLRELFRDDQVAI